MTKRTRLIAAAAGLAVAAGSTGWLLADKVNDALKAAPAAVQLAVIQTAGANSKIDEFGTETADGKTVYDLEFSIKGVSYAADISPTGEILEREVDIDMSQVPPQVLDAAKKAHPDGKVGETSIATAGDKMYYGLDMKVGKDTHEMDISAGGAVLSDAIEAPEAPAAPAKPGAKPADKEEKD